MNNELTMNNEQWTIMNNENELFWTMNIFSSYCVFFNQGVYCATLRSATSADV